MDDGPFAPIGTVVRGAVLLAAYRVVTVSSHLARRPPPVIASPRSQGLPRMCDHDGNADPHHRGLSRRRMLVGSLAAGALPLLPALAGTAGATGDPGLEGTDIDPTVGSSSTRDYAFLPPRPAS